MKFKSFGSALIAFLASALSASAQMPADIPADYFRFPIKPGVQNFLAGSMGEIRAGHFHGGIDIKTDGRIGMPVYAAADGYVLRYKASSFGYGNAIYLQHPNGLVTVYGHLDKFAEPLEKFMLRKEYENQTFELEVKPEKDIFKFKKGDLIGYSGNTGGSGGPHLHFEIRDKNDVQYNVLKFRFPEIQDHIAPELKKVALKTLSIDGRVNGLFGRMEFTPVRSGNSYFLKDTVYASGLLGLEMMAIDKFDQASNENGPQEVTLSQNGKVIYQHYVDKIPLERSRQVSWCINYDVFKRTGKTYAKCYQDDGNTLPIYTQLFQKGKISVNPNSVNDMVLTLKDTYGNTSTFKFLVVGRKPVYKAVAAKKTRTPQLSYELWENILKITANDTARHLRNMELYVGRMKYDLLPSYTTAAGTVYLYDIRAGIPDYISFCGISKPLGIVMAVPSGQEFSYTDNNLNVVFNPNSLYDTLYLKPDFGNETYTINDWLTPIFQPLKLTLKPQTLPPDPSKASVYSLGWGNGRTYEGGTWNGNTITANVKNLGKYRIMSDVTAPTVNLLRKNKDVIAFKVRDDLSGIASYRMEINGHFVLLKYEHKKAMLYSEKLDKKVPLSGEVVLKVKDNVGNESVFKTKI